MVSPKEITGHFDRLVSSSRGRDEGRHGTVAPMVHGALEGVKPQPLPEWIDCVDLAGMVGLICDGAVTLSGVQHREPERSKLSLGSGGTPARRSRPRILF